MDAPLTISLLQLVISLFVQLPHVIRNKHSFCTARMGIDWGNWRRHPKWKHTFFITDFAQTALLIQRNFTSGFRTCGLGCSEVNCRTLVTLTPPGLESLQEASWQHQIWYFTNVCLPGSHHWGDQEKDNLHTCISRQLWGTKHKATEAQQLLCSLHRLLWARYTRQEALPCFTETLLSLSWFSNSLPTTQNFPFSRMANKKRY